MTLKAIKHGFIASLTFVVCTTGIVYAAISWPATPSGETAGGKFSSVLNAMLSSGDWRNPGTGKVKSAASADTAASLSTNGDIISVYLNGCGGSCAGSDPVSSWTNVSAKNLTWTTSYNSNPTNFSHNGKGTITVAEAGTYQVSMMSFFMPTTDVNLTVTVMPYINGTVNGGENGNHGYTFGNWKGSYWAQEKHEFFYNLAANTTIAYGMYPQTNYAYWGYDIYTSMRVIRIR